MDPTGLFVGVFTLGGGGKNIKNVGLFFGCMYIYFFLV